jgi:hypothetical protein
MEQFPKPVVDWSFGWVKGGSQMEASKRSHLTTARLFIIENFAFSLNKMRRTHLSHLKSSPKPNFLISMFG